MFGLLICYGLLFWFGTYVNSVVCALLLGVECLILCSYFGVGNCGFVVGSMLGCYVIIWFWCGDCFYVY